MNLDDSGSVINSYVAALIAAVKKQGIDEAELLSLLPIEQQKITQPGARLDMALMTLLWKRAVALTGDEYLGLHLGQQIHQSAYHILGGLVLNSETIKEAIEQVLRYQALVSEGGTFSLACHANQCFLQYSPAKSKIAMTHYQVEGVISGMVTFSQNIIPQGMAIRKVEFTHTGPEDSSLYDTFFSCPVKFGSSRNGFSFDEELLALAIPHADPELFAHHRSLAEKKLKLINRSQGLINRVNRVIDNETNWFELSPDVVAKQLKLSLRQMQRTLKEEGSSYQALLDGARKEKAALLLEQGELDSGQIADKLGYNNLSSFHRAFRRWYESTPAEYREEHRQ